MTGVVNDGPAPRGVSCVVTLDLGSAVVAEAVAESLAPDDGGYIRTQVRGSAVIAEAAATDIMSLIHTLEDFLSCATAAEKVASSMGKE